MRRRYKLRIHENGDHDGTIDAGTIVQHIGGSTAIEAKSIDEVEADIRKQVAADHLARGCVYQICPPADSHELLRSLAVAVDGSFRPCMLEPAHGIYSSFCRIRFPEPAIN
ncbi:MAG: hypothetical protein JO210_04515 [Acidobacteriaceae bacterium]|nr:hypothetical protein [Acidobacteriaceae bacterium]